MDGDTAPPTCQLGPTISPPCPAVPRLPPCLGPPALHCIALQEPLLEAMELLQHTDVLLGMHGAGWTNGMFVKHSAVAMQMYPYGWKLPDNTTIRGWVGGWVGGLIRQPGRSSSHGGGCSRASRASRHGGREGLAVAVGP